MKILITGGAGFIGSIDKAKKFLGYDPQYNVEEGLNMAAKWYYSNLR